MRKRKAKEKSNKPNPKSKIFKGYLVSIQKDNWKIKRNADPCLDTNTGNKQKILNNVHTNLQKLSIPKWRD